MAEPLTITLTKTQKDELEKLRDQHAKAYVRERAAAILKIVDSEGRVLEEYSGTVGQALHALEAKALEMLNETRRPR